MKYYNEPIYKTYKETLPEVGRSKDVNVPSSMYESSLLRTSLNIRIHAIIIKLLKGGNHIQHTI